MTAKTLARAAGALALLGLLAALLWWNVDGRGTADGASPAAATRTGPTEGADAPARRAVARAPEPVLDLRVADPDGAPARVRVLWSTSPVPPLTPPFAPVPGGALPPSVRQRDVEGRTRLDLTSGHWTWIAAVWPSPPMAQRFLRLAPFTGRIERTLQLAPRRRALHAFVVDASLGAPAAGVTVRLLGGGLDDDAADHEFAERTTDAHGYACFAGLAPGRYVALAPGARPRDDAPRDAPPDKATVVFPPRTGPIEIPVLLAVPERRVDLHLEVALPHDTRPSRAVRLFLERKDDGTGAVLPLLSALRPGSHTHRARVAPGVYRFASVPIAACRVVGGDPLLTVPDRDTARARVHVALERDWSARVELQGLPRHRFPVHVYVRAEDGILDTPVDLPYLGRRTWRAAAQTVPVMPGAHRLVVLGRGHAWLSRDLVALRRGRVPVALVPATRVEVRWHLPTRRVPKAGTVLAESPLCTVVRAVARTLRAVRGRQRAVLAGSLVVPHGSVALRGQTNDRPGASWTRAIEARGSYLALEVEEDGGR